MKTASETHPVFAFESFGCSSEGLYNSGNYLAVFMLNGMSFPHSTYHR